MTPELISSLNALTATLNKTSGEIYRDKGANISPSFTEELFLDQATSKDQPNASFDYPFKSMSFTDGTDNDTFVWVIFGRRNTAKKPIKFKNNSVYVTDFHVGEISIYSPAQVGKKITLNLFADATYSSGQLIQSGTVEIQRANVLVPIASPLLTAATVTLIAAQNVQRKKIRIQNLTGADLLIGPASLGASGWLMPHGSNDTFENTAAFYALSAPGAAAGSIKILEET